MAAEYIRLPVTGDWIKSGLIAGVTAHQDFETDGAVVTVWVTKVTAGETTAEILTDIEVASAERAEQVRDLIAKLAGLAESADSSGYDPEETRKSAAAHMLNDFDVEGQLPN